MTTLLERLRTRGWRLTAQRRAVAEALGGADVHLTADEVHTRAQSILPEISRATVYNTLNELVDLGEIGEVTVGDRSKRYDPNVDDHQHFVCVDCGYLRDVHPVGVDQVRLAGTDGSDIDVTDVVVVFRGRCADCAAEAVSA
ncbi:MAG: Fur family transcriptional regulator [Actinomycetota bacterium]|nr:Fur family transcriptional regulator [Actinomycetota bacterium]